jgi:ketopantoate hydroxymethyltransferase
MWYHINILVNNATGAPVTDLIVDDMPALAAYGAPGQALQWAGGIFAGASATGIAGGTDLLENLGGWAPLADGDNGIYILEGFYEV